MKIKFTGGQMGALRRMLDERLELCVELEMHKEADYVRSIHRKVIDCLNARLRKEEDEQ